MGVACALDNRRNFANSVGSGLGQFLHPGRLHPHFVGPGDRGHPDPCYSGATSGGLKH